ncbi:MAG: pyridoxal phosphate-dependent aminotransferase [Deltaproteobacteria bacterium]|nr:pyridoxal phosphate-dependent aminotransferase [Deltaproteobacteria bacterium]
MRYSIVSPSAGQFKYEIREIVILGNKLQKMGLDITTWENIGDPIEKGEKLPQWIKDVVVDLAKDDDSYKYSATQGDLYTRNFLVDLNNKRGGAKLDAEDIIFFNGLGDAVARLFGSMKREARVIGPSPAYPTHSSAEAAHSGYSHVTYNLLYDNDWMPDLVELENKVKYNDTIAGILVINPGNPTGTVLSRDVLVGIVDIARRYGLMVIADEIYANITYNGAEMTFLSEVIEEVPGISLKGISKEFPWPGGRSGWIEVYNRHADKSFEEYITSIINAKMLEVCSTSLPQMTIPIVMSDERYPAHLDKRRKIFEARTNEALDILRQIKGVTIARPRGAFYMTVVFDPGVLNSSQSLPIENPEIKEYIESLLPGLEPDKRFAYFLLASKGICVVPLTGFYSNMFGFRITMLECNDNKRINTWHRIADAVKEYLNS